MIIKKAILNTSSFINFKLKRRLLWNAVAEEVQRENVSAGINFQKKSIRISWKNIKKRKKKKTKEMKIRYQLVLLGLFAFCVGVYLYIAVSS